MYSIVLGIGSHDSVQFISYDMPERAVIGKIFKIPGKFWYSFCLMHI